MNPLLIKKDYIPLYILLAIVYLTGLWIPLMENDSAQHATMAMRMYLENDFVNIYKGGKDYLDKPHMHFWLAAFSFKLFGVSHWAYRIPALLFTLLGAYSCNRLAKVFYGKQASHIAALVFLSTQAIFLANHDVRTDAILTGATIFGVWQLVLYVHHNQVKHAILGAIGVAIAFSTKGNLGVFVVGVCILIHIAYTKKWAIIWSWKTLVGVLAFFITITPILYAYYLQFDLHPEKIINNQTHISGVKFILWDQCFDRLTATGFKKTSPDYFFFFHTLLWAFLPWSLIAYVALFSKLKLLWKVKFTLQPKTEILTSVGVLVVLIVISFSKFKLPHYLNSLLPILSVLVAGYIINLHRNNKAKTANTLLIIQYTILTLGSTFILFLILWAFMPPHVGYMLCYLLLVAGLCYIVITQMQKLRKLVIVSVYFMIFINFCLNTQFYPKLLLYQAGNNAAKIIKSENIIKDDVFMLKDKPSWSLDFYTKRITPNLNIEEVVNMKKGTWLFLYGEQMPLLKQNNIEWSKKYEINHHRITRLSLKFLNPNTRENILKKAYLLQIK